MGIDRAHARAGTGTPAGTRRWLSSAAALLMLAGAVPAGSRAAAGQDRAVGAQTRSELVGAWRLVRLEEPGPDGEVRPADCTGLFVFTAEGRASVQVMYARPQEGAGGGPVQYAQGGYEASFGRYEVGADGRTLTYHVEGALVRTLVGKDLVRVFEISGRQMTVRSSNPGEHWRVTWERY